MPKSGGFGGGCNETSQTPLGQWEACGNVPVFAFSPGKCVAGVNLLDAREWSTSVDVPRREVEIEAKQAKK